jgi:hypothetical protein
MAAASPPHQNNQLLPAQGLKMIVYERNVVREVRTTGLALVPWISFPFRVFVCMH